MNHESMRERIALRAYGELGTAEEALLDAHLEACASCRRYAEEFARGLGALVAGTREASDELPAGWSDRLGESTRASRPPARLRPWWTAAAGFAAGVVAAVAIPRGPAAKDAPVRPLTAWERFHADEPPPLATTGGSSRRLSDYLRKQ